jgi:hypothetical protein
MILMMMIRQQCKQYCLASCSVPQLLLHTHVIMVVKPSPKHSAATAAAAAQVPSSPQPAQLLLMESALSQSAALYQA